MQVDPPSAPAVAPADPTSSPKAGPSTPWQDLHLEQRWTKRRQDFTLGKVLGEGGFSTVVLSREVATSTEYAIKILQKKHITKEDERYVASELDILDLLDHPFCVKLHCAFQDQENLYFVLNYARNGDLQRFVEKVGPLDEACASFYSAEIVLALEYLHGLDIIHRDLKPENILLNGNMHVQLADFGAAKILPPCDDEAREISFVGTRNYISPELLLGMGACKSSDLWALGGVIYHVVADLLPFDGQDMYVTFQKILKLEYDFPEYFSPKAKDLVRKLLVLDSANRLGCEEMGGYEVLKIHPFFQNITWDNLHLQAPPGVPGSLVFTLEDKNDFGNLDFLQSLPSFSAHCVAAAAPSSHLQSTGLVDGYIHHLDENSLELELKFSGEEKKLLLERQAYSNPWHGFVDNHLILKMGPVDYRKGVFDRKDLFTRKGRFARHYQLLLTEGPHLYYVDLVNKVQKGEIPWSPQLWSEAKNYRTFLIHTPKRTYYLTDRNGNARKWCQKIQEVSRGRCLYHPLAPVFPRRPRALAAALCLMRSLTHKKMLQLQPYLESQITNQGYV